MVARITRLSSQDLNRQVSTAHLSDLEFQVTARDRTLSLPAAASMSRARESD